MLTEVAPATAPSPPPSTPPLHYGPPMRRHAGICLFACTITGAHPAFAGGQGGQIDYETARDGRRLIVVRAAGSVTLDGTLDEPAWAGAPMAKDFIQNDPTEGAPATYDTEVRVVYDDEAIYFGVLARDDQPGLLTISDIKKDFNTGTSDGFRVVLDTFADRRNGYQFATNPAGAKWDAQMANEGRENNSNWDGIWEVSARVTEIGWTAEMRIVQDVEVRPGRSTDLGRELRAQDPTPQRRQLLVSPAPDLQPRTGFAGRLDRRDARRASGTQPAREAVRARQHQCHYRRRYHPRRRGWHRREVRPHDRHDVGLHRQHRFLAGGSRRAAGEPVALQPLLPREARLLPGELRHLSGCAATS